MMKASIGSLVYNKITLVTSRIQVVLTFPKIDH